MKLRIQRLGKGWYKVYREDGGLFNIVYSQLTLHWRIYTLPEVFREGLPESPPEWYLTQFSSFKEAKMFLTTPEAKKH